MLVRLLRHGNKLLMYEKRLGSSVHWKSMYKGTVLIFGVVLFVMSPFVYMYVTDNMVLWKRNARKQSEDAARAFLERDPLIGSGTSSRPPDIPNVDYVPSESNTVPVSKRALREPLRTLANESPLTDTTGQTLRPVARTADHAVDCFELWRCLRRHSGNFRPCLSDFAHELDVCTKVMATNRTRPTWSSDYEARNEVFEKKQLPTE